MKYQIQSSSIEINEKNIIAWLQDFTTNVQPTRINVGSYYDGENVIEKQGAVKGRPNYKVNVNMAKYVSDVSTGYTFGKDITYSTKESNVEKTLEKIDYINKACKTADVDFQVGGDMSAYGVGYQLVMVKPKTGTILQRILPSSIEDRIVVRRLEPEQTFFVVDNTILQEPICAIYFSEYKDANKITKTRVYVYDETFLREYTLLGSKLTFIDKTPHYMGQIPILQSLNNDDAFGDYQQILGLLDALSLAVSNSTDNLQSIANAILAVSGGCLDAERIEEINSTKVANMPENAKMEWVIKNINPDAEGMQLDNILKFIFQISQVPDLTDDAFAGNKSGVAMQFKLWGLDQLWATKVKKYTRTIYERLTIFLHLLQYQINTQVQLSNDIELTFYKNLPSGKTEEYEMVKALKGVISNKTLLKNISIVDDVDEEMEEIKTERQEEADDYGFNNNGAINEQ